MLNIVNKIKYTFTVKIIFLLLFQITILLYCSYNKNAFNVDELCTYLFSNNIYTVWTTPQNFLNKWTTSEYWNNALTVQVSNIFRFDAIYDNNKHDVHPILYYILFHIASAFDIGHFSKYPGLILNIILMCITQIFVYKLVSRLINNKIYSLLCCLIYCLSLCSVNTALILRMYMLLTCICIISIYIHYLIITDNKIILLFYHYIIYTSGILTHYYFFIFGFFISFYVSLYLLLFKRKILIIRYVLASTLSLFTAYFIFPPMYKQIIGGGYRGNEAFNNLLNISIWERISLYLNCINKSFPIYLLLAIIVCIILILIIKYKFLFIISNNILYLRIKNVKNIFKLDTNSIFQIIILLLCFSSFFLISKISAYVDDRYIMPLYPIFIIIFTCFLSKINNKYFIIISLAIIMFSTCYNYKHYSFKWSYNNYSSMLNYFYKYKHDTCIAIIDNKNIWHYISTIKILRNYKEIYVMTSDNIDCKIFNKCSAYTLLIDKNLLKINKFLAENKNIKKIYNDDYVFVYNKF